MKPTDALILLPLVDIVPALSSTTQALFSIKPGQSGNRHSVPPHGAAHASTSAPSAAGSGHEHEVLLKRDATAGVPASGIKSENFEGLSWPLHISY